MYSMSHPSWVRGLKFDTSMKRLEAANVAPFMGAWIEIMPYFFSQLAQRVAPFMGAWIEIP